MGSSFFSRYAEFCRAAGETPNSAAKAVGASSGSVTAWKNGAEPRYSTVEKLASYLGTTPEQLLGAENKNAPAQGKRKVSEEELKFALWGDCENVTDEDLADVMRYAAFVRERKKDK